MSALLLLLFLLFAYWLAVRRASAIVVLPLMASSFYLLAHFAFLYTLSPSKAAALPAKEMQPFDPLLKITYHRILPALLQSLYLFSQDILSNGPGRLFSVIVAVIIGGVLAKMLERSGVAHNLVRWTAEVAGENPLVHALSLTFISALLFTVLGGLGAVILVGTIVFPVWLSVGLSPIVSACAFLLALSLGGALNPVNWKLYTDVLKIPQATVQSFALTFFVPFLLITVLFIVLQHRKEGLYRYSSSNHLPTKVPLSFFAYLAPFLPILILVTSSLLQMKGKIAKPYPINAALLIGVIALLLSLKPDKGKGQFLLQCCFESFKEVAPAVFLIMAIGMLINAVFAYPVRYYFHPLIQHLVPHTRWMFLLTFLLLAPLALYRGPLNIWGLGFGLAILLHSAGLSAEGVMGALYSVGMIQGVCDPTNTHNVWIANQLNVDTTEILKRTLPYMWLLAFIGLSLAALRFF